jgi:hypothetical protein
LDLACFELLATHLSEWSRFICCLPDLPI